MVICVCLLKTHVCEKNVQTYVVFCSNGQNSGNNNM